MTRGSATVAAIALLTTIGCSRRMPPVAAAQEPPAVVQEVPPAPPPAAAVEIPPARPPAALTEDELFARKTLDELNAEMPLGDVFFDFDQFVVSANSVGALQKNAAWLQRWASTRVSVEGHADARGTSEYNLALGERRAEAVKDYLAGLGVSPDRVAVVSKGEEEPACVDNSEPCWQRNRRARFVITAR